MYKSKSKLQSLRSRLSFAGEEALTDPELLALIVQRPAGANTDPVFWASALLERNGGLPGLAKRSLEDLIESAEIGEANACQLRAVIELGRRMAVPSPSKEKPISCAADVAEWFRCRLQDQERECLHALLLDGKHHLIRSVRVTEGSWTCCPIDPKIVLAICLRHHASCFILIHNHPSGDPTPSREDYELTDRMIRASAVVGLKVLDHVVVGRNGYHSMADAGWM